MTERGMKNINFFIQRLQTVFLSRFLRFLTFFFWNVFYIYVREYLSMIKY